ncbi:hypothetical protein BEH69_18575 [Citrobacter freundii]|nr:hypothetical protein BEH69_18575 [Citrobacter freundii]
MKINEIKLLAIELEEWAMKDGRKGGWKKIVPLITAHHYDDLLDNLADTAMKMILTMKLMDTISQRGNPNPLLVMVGL